MKCVYKLVLSGTMLLSMVPTFFSEACEAPINNLLTSQNYYAIIMNLASKRKPQSVLDQTIFDGILRLWSASEKSFDAILEAGNKSSNTVPQEFVSLLHKQGFVDENGVLDENNVTIKAIKAMDAYTNQAIQDISRIIIPNHTTLELFFKLLAKFLTTKNIDSSTESLLNFKFHFTNYRDIVQLFAETFVDRDYYFESVKEDPFIIDCGSNLGMSILFFKTIYPQAKILAFEPSPTCLPLLKQNITNNNLKDITIVDKAISDKKGNCHFKNVPHFTLSSKLIEPQEDIPTIKVDSTILSEYITQSVDFLKMDIEGAEIGVFKDLDQSGKIKLIEEMIIECHGDDCIEAVVTVLEKNNFECEFKIETLWGPAYMLHAFQKTEKAFVKTRL